MMNTKELSDCIEYISIVADINWMVIFCGFTRGEVIEVLTLMRPLFLQCSSVWLDWTGTGCKYTCREEHEEETLHKIWREQTENISICCHSFFVMLNSVKNTSGSMADLIYHRSKCNFFSSYSKKWHYNNTKVSELYSFSTREHIQI